MDSSKDLTLSESWQLEIAPRLEVGLWLVLLAVPLIIGLIWGAYLDDSAYVIYRHARDLASGRGLTGNVVTEGQTQLTLPLYTLALVLPARLGAPLPQTGLILSVIGWGATAIAIYSAGKAAGWPVAAGISAMLVAFSPVVVRTLGTAVPWAVGLAWIAIASARGKRWAIQTCALALMLCTHLGWSTLVLAASLFVLQWVEQRRLPVWATVIVGVVALGWGLMAAQQAVAPPLDVPHPNLVELQRSIQQLLDESELYWLFLPFIGLGLLAVTRKALWVGSLWGAASILSGGAVARATMAVIGLFLVGLGIEWVIRWLDVHNLVRLDRLSLAVGLTLVAGLPLGIAQTSSLVQRYQFRPVAKHALEQRAADWLQAHTEPTATILASERLGYLADQLTLPWDGNRIDPAALSSLLESLTENPPAYCVSFRSIAWDSLMRTLWFQDGYEPLEQFESPYEPTSPFTIWGYRLRALDPGNRRPQNVRFPGGVDWVGYGYSPDRIQPGDAVRVNLLLQATKPITDSFRTVVRLVSPQDGAAWAQQDAVTPRNVPVDWWQTGQVVAEQFVLTTTPDIPVGAYQLEVSVAVPGSTKPLAMYRRNDPAPIDRVTLGYVVVPWQGKLDTVKLRFPYNQEGARLVDANLGNQIRLSGVEAPDALSPGEEFDVTIYWKALQPLEDEYVVFVHLLSTNGQPVATHDSPPMDRRYPTTAWIPGDIVPDVHHLVLSPDVPAGTYWLQAGMYQWPSMERLPVWDREGVEQPDQLIVLQLIEVR